MPAKPDRLAAALVKVALEFHLKRPWERVEPDAPFAVRLRDGERVFAYVMGWAGVERGLFLMRGERALERMLEFVLVESDEESVEGKDFLALTYAPLLEHPEESRLFLTAAGFRGRRETTAPGLFAKLPGRRPRPLNRGEMRVLLEVLRAVLAADEQELLDPLPVDFTKREMLELRVTEDGSSTSKEMAIDAEIVDWPEPVDPSLVVDLPIELKREPRLDERWIVTWVDGLIGSSEEGPAALVYTLLVLVESPEEILARELLEEPDLRVVADILADVIEDVGRPRQVVFADPLLHEAFAAALGALDVDVQLDVEREDVHELAHVVRHDMARFDPASFEPEAFEDWKAADLALCGKFIQDFQDRGLGDELLWKRYFGDRLPSDEALDELDELGLIAAFAEWFVVDHRARKRSKTELERRLAADDVPDWERELLEAHRDAELSVYRILAQDAEESLVEVEDVLGGERRTIDDVALAECDLVGWFLPLRLYEVREWTFAAVAGPPISPLRIDGALALLEAEGASLEPGSLRARAELTGRWWSQHHARESAPPPTLHNTDGDPLALHTATLRTDEPDATCAALARRPDLEYDEEDCTWTWLRPGGPAKGFGANTVLGRIELIDDKLVVEVNSAARLARARGWLERLPGVRFEGSTARGTQAERPLDDRLPGPPPEPVPPEHEEALRDFILTRYRAWLDEEIPALGGLTPRAACTTEDGRKRVARLVRTMPDAHGPNGPVRAPREELLAELGIED